MVRLIAGLALLGLAAVAGAVGLVVYGLWRLGADEARYRG